MFSGSVDVVGVVVAGGVVVVEFELLVVVVGDFS